MIQVTTTLRTPEECLSWQKWVESKFHKTEIKPRLKNGNTSYVLFREFDQSELDTPEVGYWHVTGNSFCRTKIIPQKLIRAKCPMCKQPHMTTKAKDSYCGKCRKYSVKVEGADTDRRHVKTKRGHA